MYEGMIDRMKRINQKPVRNGLPSSNSFFREMERSPHLLTNPTLNGTLPAASAIMTLCQTKSRLPPLLQPGVQHASRRDLVCCIVNRICVPNPFSLPEWTDRRPLDYLLVHPRMVGTLQTLLRKYAEGPYAWCKTTLLLLRALTFLVRGGRVVGLLGHVLRGESGLHLRPGPIFTRMQRHQLTHVPSTSCRGSRR